MENNEKDEKPLECFLVFPSGYMNIEEKINEYDTFEGKDNKERVASTNCQSIKHFTLSINKNKMYGLCFEQGRNETFGISVKSDDLIEVEENNLNIKMNCDDIKVERNDYERFQNNLVFPHRPNIKSVVAYKDLSDVKQYKCETCTYQSTDKDSFESHMMIHKWKAQISKYMRKSNSEQDALTDDSSLEEQKFTRQNSSGIVTYACKLCLFVTKYKSSIKGHMRTHNNISELTMHKCNMCVFRTKYKGCLNQHMIIHKSTSEIVMHKCKMCLFQSKYLRSLHKHSLIHKNSSGVAIYKCALCAYESKRKDLLKNHILIHKIPSKTAVYKCEVCVFETEDQNSIRYHMLTHQTTSQEKSLESFSVLTNNCWDVEDKIKESCILEGTNSKGQVALNNCKYCTSSINTANMGLESVGQEEHETFGIKVKTEDLVEVEENELNIKLDYDAIKVEQNDCER